MRISAFILMGSFPMAGYAIGGAVLLFAVVMTILFLLKSREVVILKKQCEELRETMCMMRYEEANLSRMLHTASKPVGNPEPQIPYYESEQPQEQLQEQPLEIVKPVDASEHLTEPEPVAGLELTESPELSEHTECPTHSESSEEPSPLIETSQPQKQPINERRSAIPVDLFSAWFAENEEASGDEAPISESVEEVALETEVGLKAEIGLETEVAVSIPQVTEEDAAQENIKGASVPTEETAPEHGVDLPVKQAVEVELSKEDERFCRKLERIVGARLHNPNLNIDIIAAQFGIGRTNFYRKVRELMGISPNDYLRKCRMERAAELLKGSEQPISEVCAQVGIPDAQYFSRVFKTFYGMAPSAYREQYQPNIS